MRSGSGAVRRVLSAPWSGAACRTLAFVALSVALDLIPIAVLGLPWVIYAPSAAILVLVFAFGPLGMVVLLGPKLSVLRRTGFLEVLGVDLPRPPEIPGFSAEWPTSRAIVGRQLKSPRTWRQACYHLLMGPAAHLVAALAALAWIGSLIAMPAFAVYWLLSTLSPDGAPVWRIYAMMLSALVFLLAPWVVTASVRWDTRLAAELLGPSREEKLARQVASLTVSRAGVVDAADAERRRIERDLHDGAQQRLVSLALNLGLARATLSADLPEAAQRALREAHEEAKESLAELRDLVRGLHPVVLEDRGLDAALSGIAARSPVPVRLRVDVPGRVAPTVEAIGYFIVSEALANIAKHAQATEAAVEVTLDGRTLRLVIADDGVGGADPALGTGLTGLAQRAGSVDGRFEISSPLGGPTVIKVDLPCEL